MKENLCRWRSRQSWSNAWTLSSRTASSALGPKRYGTALGWLFGRSAYSAYSESMTRLQSKHMKTLRSDWSASVYLDLDGILAELKEDDWLASEGDL